MTPRTGATKSQLGCHGREKRTSEGSLVSGTAPPPRQFGTGAHRRRRGSSSGRIRLDSARQGRGVMSLRSVLGGLTPQANPRRLQKSQKGSGQMPVNPSKSGHSTLPLRPETEWNVTVPTEPSRCHVFVAADPVVSAPDQRGPFHRVAGSGQTWTRPIGRSRSGRSRRSSEPDRAQSEAEGV